MMNDLPQRRCPGCNRLLFCGYVRHIAVKCPKCGRINEIVDDIVSMRQGSNESDGNKCEN